MQEKRERWGMHKLPGSGKLFMSGLIMAGGSGKRFGDQLKFMEEISGRPIIKMALEFLFNVSCSIFICTRYDEMEFFQGIKIENEIHFILTEGGGYVRDLRSSVAMIDKFPLIVLGADSVILRENYMIKKLAESLVHGKDAVSFFNESGASGITIIRRKPGINEALEYENLLLDPGCMMNINTREDLEKARKIYCQQ